LLDNFRTQKIIWDRANKNIFETIEANSGDSNGRKLVVQVIDQGVTENLSGTTLSLGWKSRKGAKGLDAFNVVDASKGIFEIYYTTEMLSNIGNLEASLILIDSTSRIESSTFTISVRPSTVDDESVESENSFTALTEALVKVNDFDARLAQTEDKLDKKVGDGVLAEMGDLSQEVKTAMTGGSVAVVGEGAVAKINLANDLKNKIEEIDNKENVVISSKNIFNPNEVIHGQTFLASGALTHNPRYKVTPKYEVVTGETYTISGIERMGLAIQSAFQFIHFWGGIDGETFVSVISLPIFDTTDHMTFTIPEGATHFSVNINQGSIPEKLQIEKSSEPTSYEPYYILEHGITPEQIESKIYHVSEKNLYDGKVSTNRRTLNIGLQTTANEGDTVSSFTPVEYGKHYTISGLNLGTYQRRILGYSSNLGKDSDFVKDIVASSSETVELFIDDERIKYIIFDISLYTFGGTKEKAENLNIQVEEGTSATYYEPKFAVEGLYGAVNSAVSYVEDKIEKSQSDVITEFVELNKVRGSNSEIGTIEKDLAPYGLSYAIEGVADSVSNNLYTRKEFAKGGTRSLYANVASYANGGIVAGKLNGKPFDVPSGQFDNDGTIENWNKRFGKDDYCHPTIAYNSTGVAGYKYWMMTSILPAYNMGDVVWEDEDLFVSNDGENWERVRSLYETDKAYTTAQLRLPPHNLEKTNARKHAFLPCPGNGETIEISVPADNGAPALDRENITLTELPWKHDPAMIIHDGYLYTYHSFHLPYADRNGGKNRFIVCVRTNNGIDWEVVRTDGSTMLLTEETSRQIFTKDSQGRYNYMYYAYNRNYSNPEVVKYGTNDFELVYGYNFTFRVKGTTPYNFNFSQQYPFKDVGNGNHPGLLYTGSKLYLVNNKSVFVSDNRGETFTELPHYPAWLGGVKGTSYKKALCMGEGGKVILIGAERQSTTAITRASENMFGVTQSVHQLFIFTFDSASEFVDLATNGLIDSYIDVQIVTVNNKTGKRSTRLYPAVSTINTTPLVNTPLQRVKLADLDIEGSDTMMIYVTLNSRNGARVEFGGIDIV